MPRRRVGRIFISATGQNDGKTVVSLGLIYAFKDRFERVGFIKPVGQRYVVEQDEKVDEDSVVIEKICGIECAIKDMSPIAIEKGFTSKYVQKGGRNKLAQRIKKSFKTVARNKDLVIIEGTGHAGVGSVFDLCNATVAKMLESKVVIVSSGGIGRPIDEITLNAALFEKKGVEIAGVIINKVKPEKFDKVNKLVRLGLKRKGLRVLGVIPYRELLSEPTIGQIADELDFKLLNCDGCLDMRVAKILVGAMGPHEALRYFSDKSLIITPGDREDMILTVAGYQMEKAKEGMQIAGIVLSGGIKPHKTIVDLLKGANIPLLLATGDTYSVASRVHDLAVKLKPEDSEKAGIIRDLIERYVDIELLAKHL
ncbi:MAG: AAA family ATPase [Candidatus Omnitrophica bacterium]|nr:AAA family ATPase [Candidatus Omnitrophota bacterium]